MTNKVRAVIMVNPEQWEEFGKLNPNKSLGIQKLLDLYFDNPDLIDQVESAKVGDRQRLRLLEEKVTNLEFRLESLECTKDLGFQPLLLSTPVVVAPPAEAQESPGEAPLEVTPATEEVNKASKTPAAPTAPVVPEPTAELVDEVKSHHAEEIEKVESFPVEDDMDDKAEVVKEVEAKPAKKKRGGRKSKPLTAPLAKFFAQVERDFATKTKPDGKKYTKQELYQETAERLNNVAKQTGNNSYLTRTGVEWTARNVQKELQSIKD